MSDHAILELTSEQAEVEMLYLIVRMEEAVECTRRANIYFSKHDFSSAERLYWRALEIRKESFGSNTLAVADCLDDLAELYEVEGENEQAAKLYELALVIRERVLGRKHLLVVRNLKRLHGFYNKRESVQFDLLEKVG